MLYVHVLYSTLYSTVDSLRGDFHFCGSQQLYVLCFSRYSADKILSSGRPVDLKCSLSPRFVFV